jgi:hypothetical protein
LATDSAHFGPRNAAVPAPTSTKRRGDRIERQMVPQNRPEAHCKRSSGQSISGVVVGGLGWRPNRLVLYPETQRSTHQTSTKHQSIMLFFSVATAQVGNRELDWRMALEASVVLPALLDSINGARANADCCRRRFQSIQHTLNSLTQRPQQLHRGHQPTCLPYPRCRQPSRAALIDCRVSARAERVD